MLRRNTSDSYPGASYVAADPVTESDCCRARSVAAIAAQCDAGDIPYAIRMGKIFVDISEGDLADTCLGVAPTISGMSNSEWEDAVGISIAAADKGEAEGEVWVGDAATWAGSVLKVKQTVNTWLGDDIEIFTVQGGFPVSPPAAYVYVMNACGRPNAVGFEIAWIVI